MNEGTKIANGSNYGICMVVYAKYRRLIWKRVEKNEVAQFLVERSCNGEQYGKI